MEDNITKIDSFENAYEDLKHNICLLSKLKDKTQKELLLYRVLNELRIIEYYYKKSNLNTKKLATDLIKQTNIGGYKPYMVYVRSGQVLESKEKYKKSLSCLNNILKNYSNLAKELNFNSTLELSHFLTYLLWNGYFSVNKEHFYNLKGRLFIPGLNTLDVIQGKGVCLSYAELLNNFLTSCKKESTILICKVPINKKSIKCEYIPKIERKTKNVIDNELLNTILAFFIDGITNKTGNHAITLIKDEKMLYAYDPTNLYALDIKDVQTASLVNGTGEYYIKPLISMILNPFSDSNHIFEDLLTGNYTSCLKRKDFIFTFENIVELLNNNISLLDDSYECIHNDLKFVNKEINELRR